MTLRAHPFSTLLSAGLVWLFAGVSLAAHANDLAIAAAVNDDIISSFDLEQRLKLTLATSGRKVTPDQIPLARKQILQLMIDDTLRLQEAKRFSIMVSPDEIKAAATAIEAQQGKPAGSLEAFMQQNGLSYDAFREQMRSQVAWRKLLARKVKRDIAISDNEVNLAQKRVALGHAIAELRVASVIVPPQDTISDADLLGIARDIRSQLVRGADASAVLAAYDQRIKLDFAPVSWVPESRFAPSLLEALAPLKAGEITEPVATPAGYQILRLLERRVLRSVPSENAEVALKQIILKLTNTSADTEIDSKMQIAREIARYPGSCTEVGIAGLAQFDGLNIDVNYYRTTTASMSPEIRTMVEPLPVTGITEPFASADGIHLLMLCERISVPAPLPDKEKVRAMLIDEKLELEAEKYLRQLRREAFIDVRI